MKQRAFIIILLMAISGKFSSQSAFWKLYGGSGGDFGNAIIETNDTNYVIVGGTESFGFGNMDMYLFMIDTAGNVQWSRNFGGINIDRGTDIIEGLDGYIAVGYSNSFSEGYDAFVVKTDYSGTPIWTTTFGSSMWDFLHCGTLAQDGNILAAGSTMGSGNGEKDGWLVKISQWGDTLWTQTFGGSLDDEFSDILTDFEGNIYLTGYAHSFTNENESRIWIIKTDPSGNLLWEREFGDSLSSYGKKLVFSHDTCLVIGCDVKISDSTDSKIGYIKLDRQGNVIFNRAWNATSPMFCGYLTRRSSDLHMRLGGGISPNSTSDNFEIYYGAIDQNGWDYFSLFTLIGTIEKDLVFDGDTTFDNGLILVGTTNATVNGVTSIMIAKMDSNLYVPPTIQEHLDLNILERLLNVRIAPNPVSELLRIQLSNGSNINYKIYDINGKIVLLGSTNDGVVAVNQLTDGVYFIQLDTITNRPIKFIKY